MSGIQVIRRGKVRRAKLYYLRDRVGKATRIKQRFDRPIENTTAKGGKKKGKKK